ncbi:hypothetical protein LCGC14_0885180 [marine sediment metagenome]|uniref:Uncharacterized protein n=1 Tax=marine sediment metagenome TaxID=412755 RepID=A0A0F9S7S5_9ZZZZ
MELSKQSFYYCFSVQVEGTLENEMITRTQIVLIEKHPNPVWRHELPRKNVVVDLWWTIAVRNEQISEINSKIYKQ